MHEVVQLLSKESLRLGMAKVRGIGTFLADILALIIEDGSNEPTFNGALVKTKRPSARKCGTSTNDSQIRSHDT